MINRPPHQYRDLEPELLQEALSNFLIESWSYSKVSTFVRHQKVFEMENIYGLKGKRSASSIAGNGYHTALDYFFSQYKEGVLVELPQLNQAAYEEIGSVPANQWKLQKTTPTMEAAVKEAITDATKLLLNFYSEKGLYLDDLVAIEGVELYFDEFVTVNGVDIPLPCHGKIDLVILRKYKGVVKRIIIDHKSKDSYTKVEEAALVTGMQAITYTLGYEAMYPDRPVDEVWIIENKGSKNTNGNSQLQDIRIVMNPDNRKLYELLLYENLREMIAAVKDPDHVYTINPADKYVDMAEVFDFWTRTQICEVDDFNVSEGKKDLVAKRLRKIRNSGSEMINPEIIKKFREKASSFIKYDLSVLNMTPQELIEHVYMKNAAIPVKVAHTFEGYSSNTFLLEVSAGTKIDKLYSYKLDIANALNVSTVRMPKQLAVHEGKSYVSIEYAKKRDKDLFFNRSDRQGLRIPIGKDNYGNVVVWDLANHSTPHALFCGATGSGKSVELRSVIEYAKDAGIQEIIILDPKDEFGDLHGGNIAVLSDILEIEEAMAKSVEEMNQRVKSKRNDITLIIFDEFADAIMNARKPKELKAAAPMVLTARGLEIDTPSTPKTLGENLQLLLQKGRSAGFRVGAATQRASVKIITGDTKVNFPVQICFRVPKAADSIVVLDEAGAESLAGGGDGLIRSPEYPDLVRFQAYFFKPQHQTA